MKRVKALPAWNLYQRQGTLDLTANQVRDAETHQNTADSTVKARLPEAYQWLLVPVQPDPKGALEWKAYRLTGQGSLAERASKKMRNEELLLTRLAGTSLRLEMDKVPLWRGDHVEVKQLAEDFAQYCYLPRLKDPSVLLAAIQNGVSSLVWRQDTFAYADSYDENAGRYRGLCCGQQMNPLNDNLTGLVVKPEIAESKYWLKLPLNQARMRPCLKRKLETLAGLLYLRRLMKLRNQKSLWLLNVTTGLYAWIPHEQAEMPAGLLKR